MRYYFTYFLPLIGEVSLLSTEGEIEGIYFSKSEISQAKKEETSLIRSAKLQLEEYLKGKRREFDLPLNPKGTDFQMRVWKELMKIPYGSTASYREIAERMGNPNACRAVGMANHRNPISILIPCHRVIGSNGKMVGYGGGLERKKRLLELERKNEKEGR